MESPSDPCCKSLLTKLSQDAIFAVEDDLPNPASSIHNDFNSGDLMRQSEVKAICVKRVASLASLAVAQSQLKTVKLILKPLHLRYS
jgi:hypothetical protein